MSDLAFVDDLDTIITRHVRSVEEIYREGLKRNLSHATDNAERAQEYCMRLIREGADVSDEIKEMEQTARGALLVVLLLKRQARKANG